MASPKLAPAPGQKFTTPSGKPASSSSSMNLAAMVGESLDGFRTTVLPLTIEASVMPAMIAQGKFHGGITAPTPSGMYISESCSPGSCTGVELAEIDGLGDVSVGLGPVLADFEDQPCHVLHLALAQQAAGAEEEAGA